MKNKLRLILFEKCNRNCAGCCNKDANIPTLPVIDNYSYYDLISFVLNTFPKLMNCH